MDTDIVSVHPDMSKEDVAATIARYDLLACPVLDESGIMLGIVTVDDAIDAILPEKLAHSLPRFTRHKPARHREPVAPG
jgi:Mg/Co/Ni transporter MgtE